MGKIMLYIVLLIGYGAKLIFPGFLRLMSMLIGFGLIRSFKRLLFIEEYLEKIPPDQR